MNTIPRLIAIIVSLSAVVFSNTALAGYRCPQCGVWVETPGHVCSPTSSGGTSSAQQKRAAEIEGMQNLSRIWQDQVNRQASESEARLAHQDASATPEESTTYAPASVDNSDAGPIYRVITGNAAPRRDINPVTPQTYRPTATIARPPTSARANPLLSESLSSFLQTDSHQAASTQSSDTPGIGQLADILAAGATVTRKTSPGGVADAAELMSDLIPLQAAPERPTVPTTIFFWHQKRQGGFGYDYSGPRAIIAHDGREADKILNDDENLYPAQRALLVSTDLGLSAPNRGKPGYILVGYNTLHTSSEGTYLNPTTLSAVCGLTTMADVVGPKGLGEFKQPARFLIIFENKGQPNFGADERHYSYVKGEWTADGAAEVPAELRRHHWLTKPYSPGFADDL